MRRVVAQHLAEHGCFRFFGREVATPPDLQLSIQCLIAEGSYERSEAALIERFVPRDLPVIELGGCLGLISGFVAARLRPEVDLVVVEANPSLFDSCRHNASLGGERPRSRVVQAAIAYGGDTVQFGVSANVHVNRVGAEGKPGISVPAMTLAAVLSTISAPNGYTLICDIEGAEVELIAHEGAALAGCQTAVVELHPSLYAERGTNLDKVLARLAALGLRPAAHENNVYAFTR